MSNSFRINNLSVSHSARLLTEEIETLKNIIATAFPIKLVL